MGTWKTFIQELISKVGKEKSSSQRNVRKIGLQKAVTPIVKEKASNPSILGPYHSKANTHTFKIKDLIHEQEGEVSSQSLRTKGQGETEGEHQTPEKEKHLETYQYPDIGSAVKQPTPRVS